LNGLQPRPKPDIIPDTTPLKEDLGWSEKGWIGVDKMKESFANRIKKQIRSSTA
jgi:hypothetical protein